MFGQSRTKEVELLRGYIDPDGNAHKKVVLRVPMIEDEIRADAQMARLRASVSEAERGVSESATLHALAMTCECIVSWEGIADVQLTHLRQLNRSDAGMLISAYHELEAEDALDAKKLLAEGPSGNDESE